MNGPFDTAAITSAGRRATNMDAWMSTESAGIGCWAVADGLGGYAHSEQASRAAVDAVKAAFLERPGVDAATIETLFRRANDAVLAARASRPELAQIATTLVVLVCDVHQAIWGHVGDSRLYLLRRGAVDTRTIDHSVAQARLSSGQADAEADTRSNTALLKALGTARQVRPTIAPQQPLYRDDAFLLCVDGFWDELHELEMAIDLAKSSSAQMWLEFLASRVEERQRTGSDNYTAVVVRGIDPSLPAAGARPARIRIAVPRSAILTAAALVVMVVAAAGMGVVFSSDMKTMFAYVEKSLAGGANVAVNDGKSAKGGATNRTDIIKTKPAMATDANPEACDAAWIKARAKNSIEADQAFWHQAPQCPIERQKAQHDIGVLQGYGVLKCGSALDALQQGNRAGTNNLPEQARLWDKLKPSCKPQYEAAEEILSGVLESNRMDAASRFERLKKQADPNNRYENDAIAKVNNDLASAGTAAASLSEKVNALAELKKDIATLAQRLAAPAAAKPGPGATSHTNSADLAHADLSPEERRDCDAAQRKQDSDPEKYRLYFDSNTRQCGVGTPPSHSNPPARPRPQQPDDNSIIIFGPSWHFLGRGDQPQ